jgi:eukaryotic-like serine/threonine-protein kinase
VTCRTCGGSLAGARVEGVCPSCSFTTALGMGGAGWEAAGGTYEPIHELGRGAMGTVWLARERALDRLVALKSMVVADPRLQQRLIREGQAAARLRHPHIVAVHAMGGEGASTFLAMEFIEGGNLEELLAGKPMAPRTAAAIVAKLAGALAHAHEAGLLHRDVKPSNVLMDLDGEPKLADFGMAAPLEGAGDLTNPGTIAGTPAYLAPELLAGSEWARPESDVYSLGAVLYACVAGRPPFVGPNSAAVLAQLAEAEPLAPSLFQAGLPRDLETICLKCLEKSPALRYGSAALLRADLDAFLRGEPIAARPVGRLGRLARYCRRKPALAATSGLAILLLLVLAVGGPLLALRLRKSERAAVASKERAERAEAATLERLRDSLLARSRATRLAAGPNQRDEALAAATEAAHIRPGLDARDEVIAALGRPELVAEREFPLARVDGGVVAFNLDRDRYAAEKALGVLELRRVSDDRLVQSFRGLPAKLWSAPVLSPDGRWLAARFPNGDEYVWNEARPDPAFVLHGRPYAFNGRYTGYGQPAAFAPDGRTFASALAGGGVAFHATSDGRELRRVATSAEATHVVYSDDGRQVAIGRGLHGKQGAHLAFVRVVESASGSDVVPLAIGESFQTLAWNAAGDRLMVKGDDIGVFTVPGGRLARRFVDPLANFAYFGPGGSTVVSLSTGGQATLWDAGASRPLLQGTLGSIGANGVSRDGTRIIAATESNHARLSRVEMSALARALPFDSQAGRDNVLSGAVSVVSYSPDGRWLVTAIWGAVQLRTGDGRLVAQVEDGTYSNYCSVHWAPAGDAILCASSEHGLERYPVEISSAGGATLGPPEVLDPEPGYFIADLSRDGTRVLLTSFLNNHCKVVRLDGRAPAVAWALPGAAGAIFVDHDREVVANSLDDGAGPSILLRDADSGQVRHPLGLGYGAHAAVSPDGTWAVLGTGANSSVLVHTKDWSAGPPLPAEIQGRGNLAAISPDGATIAFCAGKQVVLVRAGDGAVLAHLESAQTGTYLPGLTYSPDGTHLALWWENGQLDIWDLRALRTELASRGLDW